MGLKDFISLTQEQHSSPRLPKFSAVLDSSFNMVMQCLSMNNSTRNLLLILPRVASLPHLFWVCFTSTNLKIWAICEIIVYGKLEFNDMGATCKWFKGTAEFVGIFWTVNQSNSIV
jgi:hypothetical protein